MAELVSDVWPAVTGTRAANGLVDVPDMLLDRAVVVAVFRLKVELASDVLPAMA